MLWFTSSVLIVVSFLAFDRENILILIASLIGVTSLIYNAKGNPVGQFLMIIFSAGNKKEVKVNRLKPKEIAFMIILAAAVTFIFYYILLFFHTANLVPSAVSVTTSFLAVYLTFRRSAFYAAAYAANDIVLIILWILAALTDISYLSVVICFIMFFVNDIYGFVNWSKMRKRQEADSNKILN